jgi:hypothetical protein
MKACWCQAQWRSAEGEETSQALLCTVPAAKLHAIFTGASMTLQHTQMVPKASTLLEVMMLMCLRSRLAGSSLCCSCVPPSCTQALVVAA